MDSSTDFSVTSYAGRVAPVQNVSTDSGLSRERDNSRQLRERPSYFLLSSHAGKSYDSSGKLILLFNQPAGSLVDLVVG